MHIILLEYPIKNQIKLSKKCQKNITTFKSKYSLETAVEKYLNFIQSELLDAPSIQKDSIVEHFKIYLYAASGTIHLELV